MEFLIPVLSVLHFIGASGTQDLWEVLQIFSSFNQFFMALGLVLMFIIIVAMMIPPVRGWLYRLIGGSSR